MKLRFEFATAVPCSVGLLVLISWLGQQQLDASVMQGLLSVLLANLLVCATYTDWRWQRIRNSLSYSTFAATALLVTAAALYPEYFPLPGIAPSVRWLGALLCGTLTLAAWLCKAIGGGDVKLVAALGLLLGTLDTVFVILAAHLIAAVYLVSILAYPLLLPYLQSVPVLGCYLPGSDNKEYSAGHRIPMAGFYASGVLLLVALQNLPT